ncbi:DUF488 domain-containing protein [Candidatus Nitrospira inopinata]|jgi:uncharacterized protein (DUF488 family)|uniref:HhH-GPD domain-containing protein n=1 Tax=Candidatus Nitrospira inopinata TaxID=1715989 RepID=A0A0S4KPY8_9BACT|nr:DUF488 domain-containing protein [Candidatus Nitrospira inopinata]CUQ66499.1 conserved protein of unknown function [Candidatus Nitrospira inopinata]
MTGSLPTLWTIGHSTRPVEEFIALLSTHGIRRLIDVRTIPRSKHNPQFNRDTLANALAGAGIGYRHEAKLGGLRKPQKDSINLGWRNASFRGYADYMQTEEFRRAVQGLMAWGTDIKTAIMCAEAVPWRCHRSLIADSLAAKGWEVRHILSKTKADRHRMTSFATYEKGVLSYPDPLSRLF